MNNPHILIKTEWGIEYGFGHIQRMLTLLDFLNNKKNINTALLCHKDPAIIPEELKKYIVHDNIQKHKITIKDKRDSSSEEIKNLKKNSKIITIDDLGEGRSEADLAIDLLPNLTYGYKFNADNFPFIFGYNFYKTLFNISSETLKKNIDYLIYSSSFTTEVLTSIIKYITNHGYSCAVIDGQNKGILYKNNKKTNFEAKMAEVILSSKLLLTHFGILCFESFISGNSSITINPTEYHSNLADISGQFNIYNLGISKDFQETGLDETFSIISTIPGKVNVKIVQQKVIKSLDIFYKLLENFI